MDWTTRRNLRLNGYDYSSEGLYFITFCTHEKRKLFGKVVGAIHESPTDAPPVILNSNGQIVKTLIEGIYARYPQMRVDKYIIMPNHIHMLIALESAWAIHESPLRKRSQLSVLIGFLKMNASKQIRLAGTCIDRVWQRGYYDHIIRNEEDYLRIWDYIDTNPFKWADDRYYISGDI